MTMARRVLWTYLLTGIAVFTLMMLLGIAMRAEQARWVAFGPQIFYAMLTLHGAGMITSVALCGMGGLWYLMRREGELSAGAALVAYALVVLGVVAVLLSVFPGGFAAGWTFLYPLPFVGATWPSWATGTFLIGIMLVSLGWTAWCFQMLGFTLTRYGGWAGASGWNLVFKRDADPHEAPPPQSIAAFVVAVDGILTGMAGMTIGVALIAHWLNPSVLVDPLWAKNVTFFFGHAFANLTIYMALGWVYVGMARYTGREYHTTKILAIAWWATLVFVAIAYFHHLYMDFVQYRPLQYVGEIASYLSAIPATAVSVWGSMLLVYRSRMRWTLGSIFLFTGLVGWVVGGIGALLDASIPLNFDLHNTLWVPAHFHTYLLGGVFLFALGLIYMQLEERSGRCSPPLLRWIVGLTTFGGMTVFLLGFYVAGANGVPRRYAVEPAPGPLTASWATVGALLLLLGLIVVLIEAIRLARLPAQDPA